MPLSPGYLFIPEIKTNPVFRDLHVVVFTVSDSAHHRTICADLGADAYSLKPMELSAWTRAFTTVLQDHLPAAVQPPHGMGVPSS